MFVAVSEREILGYAALSVNRMCGTFLV